MSEQLSAEDLRRLMDVVRHRMRGEAANVATSAKKLADWRFYLHEFTGPVLAAVGFAGFLLVPKKAKPIADLATLEQLAEKKGWVVDREKVVSARKPGMMDAAVSAASNMVLRAGIAFAGQQVGKILGQRVPDPATQENHL